MSRLLSKRAASKSDLKLTNTLAAFGLQTVEKRHEQISMFGDFEEESQLTRVPISDHVEVWIGQPVAYIMQDLLGMVYETVNVPPRDLDALFIKQDGTNHRYEHQYICHGKLGDGRSSCDFTRRSWSRSYNQEQWPPPESPHMGAGLSELQTDTQANEALIERVYSGMYGKGRYGMAYHPVKEIWVMARSLPDQHDDEPSIETKMFQELNPRTYSKKGKPFQSAKDPNSGYVFLRQADVIREIQQRAIAASTGFRFDQPILDQSLFEGEFTKYWVERTGSPTA